MSDHVHQHRLGQAARAFGEVAESLMDGRHRRSVLTDVQDGFEVEEIAAVHMLFFDFSSAQQLQGSSLSWSLSPVNKLVNQL